MKLDQATGFLTQLIIDKGIWEIILKYNTNYGIMSALHNLLYQISDGVKQKTAYK